MLQEGLLFNQYRIVRRLKSGGMGEVYLADDIHLQRQVAIKVIRTDTSRYSDDDSLREAARLFLREARAIAQLNHSRILHIYRVGEESIDDIPHMYMVMPFSREGSFADWLQKQNQRLLSPWDVERIVKQAASALQHAHDRKIIHQDVKPSHQARSTQTLPKKLTMYCFAHFQKIRQSVFHLFQHLPELFARHCSIVVTFVKLWLS